MKDHHKKAYRSPEVVLLGTLSALTSAIGSSSRSDQSEFPEQFPPGTGSFDICINDDPNETC